MPISFHVLGSVSTTCSNSLSNYYSEEGNSLLIAHGMESFFFVLKNCDSAIQFGAVCSVPVFFFLTLSICIYRQASRAQFRVSVTFFEGIFVVHRGDWHQSDFPAMFPLRNLSISHLQSLSLLLEDRVVLIAILCLKSPSCTLWELNSAHLCIATGLPPVSIYFVDPGSCTSEHIRISTHQF